jgi:hypothetical protein
MATSGPAQDLNSHQTRGSIKPREIRTRKKIN